HARDCDDAALKRLPQRLQRRPLELLQLVEEQDAVMCERPLARDDRADRALRRVHPGGSGRAYRVRGQPKRAANCRIAASSPNVMTAPSAPASSIASTCSGL